MVFLLDIPALAALCFTAHPEHKKVRSWIGGSGIATCPMTEAGLITSSPAKSFARVRKFLERLKDFPNHVFWPCDMRLFSPRVPAGRSPGEMVTAYLVALAGCRAGKLATLDPAVLDLAGDRAVLIKRPSWRRAASLRAFAREVKGWQVAALARQTEAAKPRNATRPIVPAFPDQGADPRLGVPNFG